MKFWDSSAILPLLVAEPQSRRMIEIYRKDAVMLAWWATEVECASAVARLERAAQMDSDAMAAVTKRLAELKRQWQEIQPVEAVRHQATRLLRIHPLRAADALQLAAAIIACGNRTADLDFVCLDVRLSAAAQREGFNVIAA